jgi:hypothetical protein
MELALPSMIFPEFLKKGLQVLIGKTNKPLVSGYICAGNYVINWDCLLQQNQIKMYLPK